jgi:bacteriocin-like protein
LYFPASRDWDGEIVPQPSRENAVDKILSDSVTKITCRIFWSLVAYPRLNPLVFSAAIRLKADQANSLRKMNVAEPKKPKTEPKKGKPSPTAKELSEDELKKVVGGALLAKKGA